MQHYGHFITEGISACWAFDEFDVDYFAAHPFVWGRDIPEGEDIPEFARVTLRRIGIPPERIRIIRRETRFESLVVPDRLWQLTRSVNRRFDTILGKITAGFVRSRPDLRLYLSRSEFPSERSVGNERDIEELFRRAGFDVVHPQNHGLLAQLELYGRAAVLAGLAGSALHNVIFCPKGAATISIGDSRATVMRNQLVCGALAGGVIAAIPFAEDRQGLRIPTRVREFAAFLGRTPGLSHPDPRAQFAAALGRTTGRTFISRPSRASSRRFWSAWAMILANPGRRRTPSGTRARALLPEGPDAMKARTTDRSRHDHRNPEGGRRPLVGAGDALGQLVDQPAGDPRHQPARHRHALSGDQPRRGRARAAAGGRAAAPARHLARLRPGDAPARDVLERMLRYGRRL